MSWRFLCSSQLTTAFLFCLDYDIFISYRVASERELAPRLHDKLLSTAVLTFTASPRVYLDRESMKKGRSWEQSFIDGILSCRVFAPLCTWGTDRALGSVGRLTLLTAENMGVDSVLLEWVIALELHRQGRVKEVLPLLFGAAAGDGFSTFPFESLAQVPDAAHEPTLRRAREHLEAARIEVSEGFEDLTVRGVVDQVLAFQGVKLFEHGMREAALDVAAKALLELVCE